jgi:hypothetical protein
MKTRILLVIVLSLVSSRLWAQNPSIMRKVDLTSQVCFLQPEVNGRMNVEKSRVSFSNYQQVTLMGGQAACLYVRPGDYSFRIEFLDSEGVYGRKSKSPEYKIALAEGDRVVYEVYPTAKGPTYTGGWRARLIEKHASKK